MGNLTSSSAKKEAEKELTSETVETPVEELTDKDREILEKEKKILDIVEDKVLKLESELENAINIADEENDDDCEIEEKSNALHEFSEVKCQVNRISEKFDEYNEEITKNEVPQLKFSFLTQKLDPLRQAPQQYQ